MSRFISWDAEGFRGRANDGRAIVITESIVTGRMVAVIPLRQGGETRRSERSLQRAQLAAEAVVSGGG